MYVCICSAVTDGAIAQAAREGAHTLEQLGGELGVGVCCGMCRETALEIVTAELARGTDVVVWSDREITRETRCDARNETHCGTRRARSVGEGLARAADGV
jgi:bacterioferritin-associated ferredoxin